MMNYELAKKLKNNRFPQVLPKPDFLEIHDALEINKIYDKYQEEFDPYRPTLEELINACEKFGLGFCLEKHFSDIESWWVATLGPESDDGETPQEAVANLWLELNKKYHEKRKNISKSYR